MNQALYVLRAKEMGALARHAVTQVRCRWGTPASDRESPLTSALPGTRRVGRTSLRCCEFSVVRLGAGRGLFAGSGVA